MSASSPGSSGSNDSTVAAAFEPRRRPSRFLRGLAAAALIAFLAGAAFLGGAVVDVAIRSFSDDEPADVTQVRPQPSVVTAMRDLARLETTTFHMERVIELTEKQKRFWGFVEANDAILLVAAGDVAAGVDLQSIGPDDIEADPATRRIRVLLPLPRVLSTRIDSDRTYVHNRDTDILARRKENLETRARQRAEDAIRSAALDAGLLDRSRESAQRTLEVLLRSFGYEHVEIVWQDE